MAQAIEIFSKFLTDTDIKKRLAIPAKILDSLPAFNGSHAVTVPLMYGTRMWPIVCTVRKTGHKKPVFSRGWRKFVVSNNFDVGDELTLFKVQDEAGSFHYRARVDKPAGPSRGLSPSSFSLNNEVDETTGTSPPKACNFQSEQQQPLKDDAPIKQEKAITELADVAADALVAFFDHVTAKPASRVFGSDVSAEATSKAHFKTEEKSKMKFSGTTKSFCMGEPPLNSYYMTNEEREINFFALPENGALAYGTSQAVGNAYYKSCTDQRLNLDLILGLSTPCEGEVNLDLTLAPPIVDGQHEIKESQDRSPKERAIETAVLELSKAVLMGSRVS